MAERLVVHYSHEPLTLYEYVAKCRGVENSRIASFHRGYISLEPRRLKPSQIKANYEGYKTLWEDQHHVLRCRHDAEVLTKLLPKFPNLTSFLVPGERIPLLWHMAYHNPLTPRDSRLSECWERVESQLESRVDSHYLLEFSVDGDGAYEGFRKAKVFADVIAANSVHPTRFCHAYLHHFFFDPRINKNLDGLIPLLDNLTHFDIGICMRQDEPGFTRQACRSTLRQHALQAMIAAMPNLEALSLSFPGPDHSGSPDSPMVSFHADLHDVIPSRHVIPRLRTLCLSGVETTLDELVNLYMWHKDTLKAFQLSNIGLGESWYKLLPVLKGILFRDVIREVGFGGFIYGCGPDGTMELWCLHGWQPRIPNTEPHVADSSHTRAPSLGQRVAGYLWHKDETELPLNRDNMVCKRYIPMSSSIGEEQVDPEFWRGAMERIMQGGCP